MTITGTGLTGATAVTFGASPATSFTVVDATTITAVSPPGSAGVVNIAVTTPGGASTPGGATQFTYADTPTITSLSPTSGPTAGGSTVTITGTGLTGATAVTFGASPATSFTVVNATTISAVSPAGGAGVVNVAVTSGGGEHARWSQPVYLRRYSDHYESQSHIRSNSRRLDRHDHRYWLHRRDRGGLRRRACNQLHRGRRNHYYSGFSGGYRRRGQCRGHDSRPNQHVHWSQPVYFRPFTNLSPTSGPIAGGTTVTITGIGFTGATAVAFGAKPATSFTVVNATTITAVSPAGTAGAVNVAVTTPAGASAAGSASSYNYALPPAVEVPTLGEWAMIALTLMLAAAGYLAARRRLA